jgi:hypothetical protein
MNLSMKVVPILGVHHLRWIIKGRCDVAQSVVRRTAVQ